MERVLRITWPQRAVFLTMANPRRASSRRREGSQPRHRPHARCELHIPRTRACVFAIEPMLKLLPTVHALPLPTDEVLGNTTVNIGTIREEPRPTSSRALRVRTHVPARERCRSAP